MEPLGDAIARLRTRFRVDQSGATATPEPEPEPNCPICKDHGFVRKDVEITHPDFGRALPCTCRAGEMRDRLRRRSNLGQLTSKTFETFQPDGRDERVPGSADAYGKCQPYGEAPAGWLVLIGPYGCGKTHLAAAIANRQIELGNEVFFTVVPDLLDHLRATFGPGSDVTYDELFEAVRNVPLLVLDDLGMQSETSWAREKLYQVLNHRLNADLPTVITTNVPFDELDERLRVRLKDTSVAQVIEFGGHGQRSARRPRTRT